MNEFEDASRFIRHSSDAELLFHAIEGRIGYTAAQATLHTVDALLDVARDECAIIPLPAQPALVMDNLRALRQWSPAERALMDVIGRSVVYGRFWGPLVEMIQVLDRRWLGIQPADGIKVQELRDRLVQCLYVTTLGESAPAVSQMLCSARMRSAAADQVPIDVLERAVLPILKSPTLWTPGVLLLLGQQRTWRTAALQEYLPPWFSACWASDLYHVRLDAVEAVLYAPGEFPSSIQHDLLQQLQVIWDNFDGPVLWGPIELVWEALVKFGTVESPSSSYLPIALQEVQSALIEVETESACLMAKHVTEARFEWHVGEAYCDAIQKLTPEQRFLLLLRAAKDESRKDLGAPTVILQELLEYQDARVAEALVRWAQVPVPITFIANEGPEAFVYANAGLGILGHTELVNACPALEGLYDRIWCTVGKLIRNYHAIGMDSALAGFRSIWLELYGEDPWIVLNVLQQVSHACRHAVGGRIKDPTQAFIGEMRRISVRALAGGVPLFHPDLRPAWRELDSTIYYAIRFLEEHGDATCIEVLQRLVEHRTFGQQAISALRAIRQEGES
jgi:hypothetical protein